MESIPINAQSLKFQVCGLHESSFKAQGLVNISYKQATKVGTCTYLCQSSKSVKYLFYRFVFSEQTNIYHLKLL